MTTKLTNRVNGMDDIVLIDNTARPSSWSPTMRAP